MPCSEKPDPTLKLPAAIAALDERTRLELEAAAFRGLIAHLQRRTDAQNIDLMNLAGFCRNCLSKWYLNAAKERGLAVDYDLAREVVYGMPYPEWKQRFQQDATPEQQRRFEETTPLHAFVSGHGKPG
jgi:hypothetical protein